MKLELVRDLAGVYPVYYYHKGNVFLHSDRLSNLVKEPGFERKINRNALALYFQFGYIPEPYSIYENTWKLSAGHSLEYSAVNNKIKVDKYWDIWDIYKDTKLNLNESDAIKQTEEIMLKAYKKSFNSATNPGVLLSGGYDSTSVAALLQNNLPNKIKTFSIGFDDPKYNEANFAKQIAEYLGTEHYEYYCTQQDVLTLLPKLPEILDEPMGDSSIIPTTLACLLAANNVDSILSADGPDELLGGYDKYLNLHKKKALFGSIPSFAAPFFRAAMQTDIAAKLAGVVGIGNASDRLNRFSYMLGVQENELLKINSSVFTPKQLTLLFNEPISYLPTNYDVPMGDNVVENAMALDFKTSALDAVLVKVNRAATFAGVKNIEPVQSKELIEHFVRLPLKYKINQGNKKYILKKIVHQYIPKEIIDRPKQGFGLPLINWFKEELKEYLLYYLSEERLKNIGLFNVSYIINLRNEYLNGKNIDVNKVWLLLVFILWYERWVND